MGEVYQEPLILRGIIRWPRPESADLINTAHIGWRYPRIQGAIPPESTDLIKTANIGRRYPRIQGGITP